METAVNKKFLKTSSLLTSDFTAPLDPADLTSSTHSYDERTTFWALTEDQRQHAHNHSDHLCRYASSKALRSRSALLRAQKILDCDCAFIQRCPRRCRAVRLFLPFAICGRVARTHSGRNRTSRRRRELRIPTTQRQAQTYGRITIRISQHKIT